MSDENDANLPEARDSDRPEDWIGASETLRLVVDATLSRTSNITICTRAHVGLVRARADLLIIGPETRTDHAVHKEFWWARGHEALTQNWETGDFETWIDKRFHIQAFGVKFHRDDVQRMLPATGRAKAEPERPRAGGRPMSRDWPEWVAELVAYIHQEGIPKGEASRGADGLIEAVASRLEARGGTPPSRSTVQDAVNAVLRRLREG